MTKDIRWILLAALLFDFPLRSAQVGEWQSLFNGKDLSGWEVIQYAGPGEVQIQEGQIHMDMGVALTGIRYTNELPKSNYEIAVTAMKKDGMDFFAAITFPVKDTHATFVNGGWGGALVGVSSLDGMDASENETTTFYKFEKNKWYEFLVRVLDNKIQAWINNEKVVDINIADRKVSMRPGEIEDSVPFGISNYQTSGALKEVKVRRIPAKVKKFAFLAGKKSHGPGEHEYEQGLRLFQRAVEEYSGLAAVDTDFHLMGWPVDEADLEDADTIVIFCDGSDHNRDDHPIVKYERWRQLDKQMKRGAGLVCIHYTVFVPNEDVGPRFLQWLGGYFDYQSGSGANKWFSKIETRDYEVKLPNPEHPICRGVEPFEVKEEYYFNMRFPENKKGLTQIASFDSEKKDWSKVVGWAYERENGGRSFGYTGGHFHSNWENENVRRMLLNAILWTAKVEPPQVAASK